MSIKRTESRASRTSNSAAGSASREITFVLITVVLVAVVCQTPLAVFHCVRYVAPSTKCGFIVYYLEAAAKLLVNINSCANFVIYCLVSPKFRTRLLESVTCRPRARLGSTYGSPTDGAAVRMSMRNTQNVAGAREV